VTGRQRGLGDFLVSRGAKLCTRTFASYLSFFVETTQQLEGKLKEKVERRLVEKINFSAEQVTPMLKPLFFFVTEAPSK
jgi:hypothetical protein